jgi:hypothetical protein
MSKTLKLIRYNEFITKYLVLISLFYSPFVFFAFVNETLRLSLFILLIFLLFIKLFFQKFKIKKILNFSILFIFLIIYIISSIYINNNNEGFRSSIGYSLILILSFLVYLNVNTNINFFNSLVKYYIFLINIIILSIIINFIFNVFGNSINFLTPYFPNNFSYDYNASVFGLSINKSILGVNISRNFWFFTEPVYTAPFILINIFLIGPSIIEKRKYFIILNIIIGILTFSYLFFIGYLILLILKYRPYILILFFIAILFAFVYFNFDYESNSLISSSSSSDRLLRIQLAFEVLSKFSTSKIFLGSGYLFSQSLDMGVSAGIFSSFIEGGLIGMIIPLVLAIYYTNYNKVLICIISLSLFTIEPYKMPFFWIVIIIAGKLISLKNEPN